jgi:hypothetical protein
MEGEGGRDELGEMLRTMELSEVWRVCVRAEVYSVLALGTLRAIGGCA